MEAEAIFDKFEHTGIYIVDSETMITYYENPIAQKYSVKNRIGLPCYSIHGNTSMCSSCPVRNENHTSFVNRADHNMIFIVQSEKIDWNGRPSYLITVKKQEDLPAMSYEEKSRARMSRAMQKSVNVYTEINLETMRYRQINIKDADHYTVSPEGDYAPAYEHMCNDEIAEQDVESVRRTMAPEILKALGADSNGPSEVVARYHLKGNTKGTLMQSRAIFMRDELPHYVVSVATDVTEQMLISETRNTLENILNNVDMGVYAFEFHGDTFRIVAANNAIVDMLGRPRNKVFGAGKDSVFKNIHPDDYAIIYDVIDKMKKPNNRVSYEYRTKHSVTGEYIWLAARGHSVAQPDGSVMAYICYADITKRKELEEVQSALELEKAANKTKSEFFARMSHDIRTPMNAIIGLTSLSLDEEGLTPQLKENLSNIHGSGEFLLGLVNDILDMSKIESGTIKLKLEPYYYMDFLAKLKAMFEPQCKEKQITFDFEEVTVSTVVMADKLRMDQVFFNILSNAVKYTPAGGKISYRTENVAMTDTSISADYIIEDTGIGISQEFLKHIFEPFEQEDTAYSAQLKGTGLGMSIAKSLVDLMGGTIRVESTKNVGTKVIVHLGFSLYGDKLPEREIKADEFDYLMSKRILLAEDHPLNARIAKKLLEKKGMLVIHVENGKTALDDFAGSDLYYYDAILMDIRMPIMDGLESTAAIRKLDRPDAKNVPIIAMSANAYYDDVKKSLDAGMNAHLAKPIDNELLYKTLVEEIRKRDVK